MSGKRKRRRRPPLDLDTLLEQWHRRFIGDQTLVPCGECEHAFPFRDCRLLDHHGELVFICEPCYRLEIAPGFRLLARTSLTAAHALDTLAHAAHTARTASDPAEREEALDAWLRTKLILRGNPTYG